ncbi:hypothetical protein [Acinetobacter baumannii]|uniref:hypothetical protein n=1 Tax=Acinetobacter baumannii TaxID=470 RepID=UPI0012492EBD|nr:hypothetical protein [Acinetobacter baumannii]KAB0455592.1 hypothetical protein EG248_05405 [Acinetobacter baumannii]
MTFNEWLETQDNFALLHANCCRIAYEASQQLQQAKVEELEHDKEFAENSAQEWTAKAIEERNAKLELQKRVDAALETIAKVKQDTTERDTYLELEELEQALKGGA